MIILTISGQRGTGKTRLYESLKRLLPEVFPDREFVFLGNPFESLPFPLLWGDRERKLHPTTLLLDCWAKMNQTTTVEVRPAIKRGAIVVTDGFGLDAYLYATACSTCRKANKEVFNLHKLMVDARIKAQGIEPPHYFISQAAASVVDDWIVKSITGVANIPPNERRRFYDYEERAIRRYFGPDTGQKPPIYVDASLSIEKQSSIVISAVRTIFVANEGARKGLPQQESFRSFADVTGEYPEPSLHAREIQT